jgi:hypothetical protein
MTTHMVRKQIYIQKRQDILIKRLAQAQGLSEAEVIRQAIERELSGSTQPLSGNTSAFDDFAKLALSKRSLNNKSKPYQWNREEIYTERERRWIRDQDQDQE